MRWLAIFAVIVSAVLVAGCERRQDAETEPHAIQQQKYDLAVQILLDTSGSYRELMKKKAHPFCMHTIDSMFRARMGANDRVMLGQISGTSDPMFFDGNPRTLQTRFSSARALSDELMRRPDPGGSRVFDSISDATERLLAIPGVREKKTKVALICLTDMDDNVNDESPEKSLARLLSALKELAKCDSCIGIYWCDPRLLAKWTQHLNEAGFGSRAVIEDKHREDPPLPTFQ